jgi:hypothetical protein
MPNFQKTCAWCKVRFFADSKKMKCCSQTCGARNRPKPIKEDPCVRFWRFVDKSNGEDSCWTWNGSRTRDGYGHFGINRKTVVAHRFSWALSFGSIPDGSIVCHKCDTPSCVNPLHLFIGTDLDNARDRERKGRGGGKKIAGDVHWTRCRPKNLARGNANGMRQHPESTQKGTMQLQAKLNDDMVRSIRGLAQMGLSQSDIARMFPVSS